MKESETHSTCAFQGSFNSFSLLTLYFTNVSYFLLYSAPETCIRDQEVQHKTPPTMEGNSGRTCHRRRHHQQKTVVHSHHASGCINAIEFDLRHVEICIYLP